MPLSINNNLRSRTRAPGYFIQISSFLVATLVAVTLIDNRKPDTLSQPLTSIDRQIVRWKVLEIQTLSQSQMDVLRPSSYISRKYARQGRELQLFIAYYSRQRAGDSMHSPKVCLPGSGWGITQHGTMLLPVATHKVEINEYHIQKSNAHLLVLYWYQSRNRIIASEYLGKLLLFKDALMGDQTSGSIVRIILPDDSLARSEGAEFARSLIPQVWRCFGGR
jgi:EpsI family protein